MIARASLIGLALLGLGAVACASSQPPIAPGLPPRLSESTTCPFGDRGVRVAIEDTPDGVDVTFSGGSRLEELRHRARDAAAMYGPGAHRGLGHQGLHGDGEHHGLGLKELSPPVRAVEVDTDDGARIHITPLNAADAVAVRAEVHARVTRTRMGDCP